jgi:hypothetical protein
MEAKGAAASWTSAEPWAADRAVRYRHRAAVDRSSQRAERRFLFSRAAWPVTDRCAGRRSCSAIRSAQQGGRGQAFHKLPGFGGAAAGDPVDQHRGGLQPAGMPT